MVGTLLASCCASVRMSASAPSAVNASGTTTPFKLRSTCKGHGPWAFEFVALACPWCQHRHPVLQINANNKQELEAEAHSRSCRGLLTHWQLIQEPGAAGVRCCHRILGHCLASPQGVNERLLVCADHEVSGLGGKLRRLARSTRMLEHVGGIVPELGMHCSAQRCVMMSAAECVPVLILRLLRHTGTCKL